MRCPSCKKEIADSAHYCEYCGHEINRNQRLVLTNDKIKEIVDGQTGKYKFTIFILVAIIILLIIVSSVSIATAVNTRKAISTSTKSNQSTTNIFNRSATVNDLNIIIPDELSLSIHIYITPKYDIKDLQITFTLYSENNTVVYRTVETLGNVSKDKTYNSSITFSNLGLSGLANAKYIEWTVTGGTISIFA